VPPVAVTMVEYGELSVALGSGLAVVMFRPLEAVLMVRLRACVVDCAGDSASVALTVKENVPLREVVPEITPAVERDKPVGRVPLAKLHARGPAPPVAASVWL
jgi:hypothetical protein